MMQTLKLASLWVGGTLFLMAILGGGLLWLASLYTPLAFALMNLPCHFSHTTVSKNIPYGPYAWQKLDIYSPKMSSHNNHPVILFIYGGRWSQGSKDDYCFAGETFAKRGFVTVVFDYNKYPNVRFPAFVEDSAKALSWVSDHIEDYQGDRQRIFVSGHSAGAHIGALLATDTHYMEAEGKNVSDIVRGFAGISGPYAFTPDEEDLKDIFGPPKNYALMQVPTFVNGHQPPMLLLYGDADQAVGRFNLDRLTERIHEKGGRVETIIYPNVNHGWILAALSWLNLKNITVLDDIIVFFNSIKT